MPEGQLELPVYRCHKKVSALKIKRIDTNADGAMAYLVFEEDAYNATRVNGDWLKRHDPQPGGYYVVYADGYESYSPAEPFESGYTRTGRAWPLVRELTGHKVNPANDELFVAVRDEAGDGGASYLYTVHGFNTQTNASCPFAERYGRPADHTTILFQNGPIPEKGVNGITQEVLIAILIDRLEGFQSGPYACRENALALTKLQEAQHWLHHRTRGRVDRGVEGTHQK